MSWTLCTSGAAIKKAGNYANAIIIADGSALAEWSDQVEGAICAITKNDWITKFAGLGASKNILSDTASDLIAMKIVNYSIPDYSSRAEAQTILNVLDRNSTRNIEVIKDQNNKTLW